jgi:ABC-type uncharacterized transport system auxiliary subunit
MIRTSFLFLLLIFSGCGPRRSIPARYYVLEYPVEQQFDLISAARPVPNSCLIRTVQVHPAYSSNQIAIRGGSHEIRYFSFNQWAVRPEQSLTTIMIQFMKRHNIFQSIQTPALFTEADYVIETTVYFLELIDDDNDYLAHLSLEYRLRESAGGEVVLNHRSERKQILEEKNLNLFAAAISSIFVEELGIFARSILADLR